MRWPFGHTKRQSSSPRRYFRPELMRLEDREVLSTMPGLTGALDSVGIPAFQSTLPALVNSILAIENNVQAILSSFTTQLNGLNQELHLLQSENYLLLHTIQQLEHSPPPSPPPSTPPTHPPGYLSSFAGTYNATQIPSIVHGDIPASTPQTVSFTLNADGSGVLAVSPFDGTALSLRFNPGSITYNNGTIGFTYPSGLTSYIQFSFTPGSDHQLSGNIYAHGDWGQGGSYVVIAFDNITLT